MLEMLLCLSVKSSGHLFYHKGLSSIEHTLLSVCYVTPYCGGGLVTKSCLTLATPWTVACQAPLSVGFFSQEYCGGLSFPSPGGLPDPGIEPGSLALQADSLQTAL